MSRLLSIPIGFLPLIFVFFVPEILHLSFFTRALRLSISVVAIVAFYLPGFGTNCGATLGLVAATITTTAWFVMGDPFGIDDIYVALVTPALVMALDRLGAYFGAAVRQVPDTAGKTFNSVAENRRTAARAEEN